jgi:hypothetical protein
MKNKKILLVTAIVAVMILGLASVSFAATGWKTPAEILSGLTDRSVESVQEQRQAGDPYGLQAVEAGVSEAFREQRLEQVKIRIEEAVESGTLTREEADERLTAMENRGAECDGTGIHQGEGGLRMGNPEAGNGLGQGQGQGQGRQNHRARQMNDGVCPQTNN